MSLIVLLGPTAVGKTKLAVQLASELDGEIISADSRQVYQSMDIGTGKDLDEYVIENTQIPYHLINIKEAGEEYSLFQFQQDFFKAYKNIIQRGKIPILCGGTGLYLESALADYQLLEVPMNLELRQKLSTYSKEELVKYLLKLNPKQHNSTDTDEIERCLRAIEIEVHKQTEPKRIKSPVNESIVFGIRMERSDLRNRIEQRLDDRFKEGMIEEVENLLKSGISHEMLYYYGLEYRYISLHLKGELKYEEMQQLLLQAIRRFAKKQMTWFRRMEKKGTKINWIEATWEDSQKLAFIKRILSIGKEIKSL